MNDVERSGNANSIRPQVDRRSEENAQQHVLQNAQTTSVEHFRDTVLVRSVGEELTMAEDNSSLPAGHDKTFPENLRYLKRSCCWVKTKPLPPGR